MIAQQKSGGAQHQAGAEQFSEIQRGRKLAFEYARWRHLGSLVSVSEKSAMAVFPCKGTAALFARSAYLVAMR
jgi:hypothetical protein